MKKNIRLVVAIVAGIMAVFLVMSYLKKQEQIIASRMIYQQKEAAPKSVKVLVATKNIPTGTALSDKDVKLKEVLQAQPRAATSVERVVGRITIAPIEEDEQVLMTKLSVPESTSSLAMKTPPGKRAITFPIDVISGLSGMIRPGDHVDIMTTIPVPTQDAQGKVTQQPMILPLFQSVLILAVGSNISTYGTTDARQVGGQPTTITVALDPQEAAILAFVQEQVKSLRLTLRSPTDTQAQAINPAGLELLFKHISSQMPQAPMQQAKQEEPQKEEKPKEIPKVEIYRGTQREVVALQ